jgi:hypothetical protein
MSLALIIAGAALIVYQIGAYALIALALISVRRRGRTVKRLHIGMPLLLLVGLGLVTLGVWL